MANNSNKTVLCGANAYTKKYFYDNRFDILPVSTKNTLNELITACSDEINGVFVLGFYNDGTVFCEATGDEADFEYDEINARLTVDAFIKINQPLLIELKSFYEIFVLGIN